MGHAGSDIEFGYNSKENIEQNEFNDPLLHSSRILINNKSLSKDEILKLYPSIKKAENKINWRPKISFNRGLKSTIKFYYEQAI